MKQQYEAFADSVARGIHPSKAYKEIYPKAESEAAIRVALTRLMKRPEIVTAIDNKKKELANSADQLAIHELKEERKWRFLTIHHKREVLHDIAYCEKAKDADKIRAIELDAELTGEGFRPQQQTPGETNNTYNTLVRQINFKTNITTTRQETKEEGK